VNLDPIASQLAVEVCESETKSVAVADFQMIDGKFPASRPRGIGGF
jgi:hypothetical protein